MFAARFEGRRGRSSLSASGEDLRLAVYREVIDRDHHPMLEALAEALELEPRRVSSAAPGPGALQEPVALLIQRARQMSAAAAATPVDPRSEWRTMDLELINFDSPTNVRAFEKGRFELYRVGPMTLGRASYEPGWKWSQHVGPATGESSCQVEHVGLVLSGEAVAKMDDGREIVMRAGDFFYIPPGHDSSVVGDEPYVSLHILGSQDYATA